MPIYKITFKITKIIQPNSCGKLVSNVKAKVVDLNSGDSVGVDQPGELWIK